jgi:lipopolysaccharide transport system permease protein
MRRVFESIPVGALKAVWSFRAFVFGSVKRDFQLRYRGTMLGIAWTVLQPLAMILIYTLVFSQVMKNRLQGVEGTFAYSIHPCSGVITWGLFAEIIQRSQSVFIDNANLLKKLSFPRLTLPVIAVATALLNFLIVFALFLGFLLITGNLPGMSLLAIIPMLIVEILLAAGLGMILGVLNVFFRDAGQLCAPLLQFWFWATPVVYPASILPAWLKPWMTLNPMYHLVEGYQGIFLGHQWPDWQELAIVALLATCVAAYALRLYRRHADEIVDEL